MTYAIAHINEGATPIEALAAVALHEKPAVQQLLHAHGYKFSGEREYLKALSDASFDTAFVVDLLEKLYQNGMAHASGGGFSAWGGGFFNALGGLFNLGGSIATGVTGKKALQEQADAARAASADQLQAAYYQLQAVMEGTQAQISGQQAQIQLVKIVFIGVSILSVLIFIGLIVYKRFIK